MLKWLTALGALAAGFFDWRITLVLFADMIVGAVVTAAVTIYYSKHM